MRDDAAMRIVPVLQLLLVPTLLAQQPAPAPTPAPGSPQQPRNRLAAESSPYLRQHQHDPVPWWPFGPEAFAEARRTQKPIFLSLGFSACHWCHVMAAESFADPAIGTLLGEQFVCIKVDRDERPDVDEIYLAAVQAMGRPGGWPLSVWLTPDGKPFFGGTYFPKEDRDGLPGFRRVCERLATAWREQRRELESGADGLTKHLQQVLAPPTPPGELDGERLAALVAASRARWDAVHAGFGTPPAFAPKFPNTVELLALLRGPEAGPSMAIEALREMARSGLHDQVGGGFHRYTTDRQWRVPHFEKMLADNALLATLCLEAQRAGHGEFAELAARTLDWLLRELALSGGGFAASLDAVSEGQEGRFYTWTVAEFERALGDDAREAATWFGLDRTAPAELRQVLVQRLPDGEPGAAAKYAACCERLRSARDARGRPARDEQVVLVGNGLVLRALAFGHAVLGDVRYRAAARRCADFLLRELRVDGRLRRTQLGGTARHAACLDDHGAMALGLLALFEVDPDPRWLQEARTILAQAVQHFGADDGGFHYTADDAEALVARSKNALDGSLPSGTALCAEALLRLGLLLGDEALYARGLAAIRANMALLQLDPAAAPALVTALQFHLGAPREIVVVGPPDDPRTQALLQAAWARPSPRVVLHLHDGNRAALEALARTFAGKTMLDSKTLLDGAPAAYVCQKGVCERPTSDPKRVRGEP